jgi:1-aminocyclopropane-1-carboxylate deaminase
LHPPQGYQPPAHGQLSGMHARMVALAGSCDGRLPVDFSGYPCGMAFQSLSSHVPVIDWQPQAPLQPLALDWLARAGVEVAVLRLDLIDPLLGGNKWYKLQGHLQQAAQASASGLISVGGAHSNHLHALAAAGACFGFASIGLLRGEPQDTPTVRDLHDFGMQLHWLGYGGYRARHQPGFWDCWRQRYPGVHCIDEGGAGLLGMAGVCALVSQVYRQLPGLGWTDFDGWWLASGSGTSAAGLVLAEQARRTVHLASAVPLKHGLAANLARMLADAGYAGQGYRLLDASRGGFGVVDAELACFLRQTEAQGSPRLEPLYTAKAMMALRHQVQTGYFAPGTRLIFMHSGGLQGRRAMQARLDALTGHAGFNSQVEQEQS